MEPAGQLILVLIKELHCKDAVEIIFDTGLLR